MIGNRFLDIINNSIETGVFPEKWKSSTITPVPKVDNTTLCDEFRPINTVPTYEKVLELVVKDQLVQYCENNNVIVQYQSGFRSKHSCESVINSVSDIWLKGIDNGEFVVAVFLDFKRAFEMVNRNFLLEK